MLYVVLGMCAVVGSFALCRHIAAKVNLDDSNLRELVARRLLQDVHSDELAHLREENAVMRNLLLDIVENEASLADSISTEDRCRRESSRRVRRRELYGEAVIFLDKSAAPKIQILHHAL